MGVLCHKSFDASPVTSIASDRLCALLLKVQDSKMTIFTIIGVYLPCSDKGIEFYQEHLDELEKVILFVNSRCLALSWF